MEDVLMRRRKRGERRRQGVFCKVEREAALGCVDIIRLALQGSNPDVTISLPCCCVLATVANTTVSHSM